MGSLLFSVGMKLEGLYTVFFGWLAGSDHLLKDCLEYFEDIRPRFESTGYIRREA